MADDERWRRGEGLCECRAEKRDGGRSADEAPRRDGEQRTANENRANQRRRSHTAALCAAELSAAVAVTVAVEIAEEIAEEIDKVEERQRGRQRGRQR